MPFIPHTDEEVTQMLSCIGVDSIDALFDEIPKDLQIDGFKQVPPGLPEMEVEQLLSARARLDGQPLCFLGAGAYEHHIPAAVWEIATRGEFYSAYTPYQAEASQGTLQLIYEYQSMMAKLTGMDLSNASLYDGASGLAEAILMAVRANRNSKSRKILVPRSLHPNYRRTVHALVKNQGIELIEIDYDRATGQVDQERLAAFAGVDIAALVIPQPNFFGVLEEVDGLTDWAHQQNAFAIAVVNPISLGLLKPPGQWGATGVDICCGEGQPLGIPLASGGPYFGFMTCRTEFVRQMPGRIVGRTVDLDGKEGYTLTLQAREQHIRRSKATSNICTNQGLLVTAATIYMSLLGPEGLRRVALQSHQNCQQLVDKLSAVSGVSTKFTGAVFHERVLQLSVPVKNLLKPLSAQNILPGFVLEREYPELGNCLLVNATETKTLDNMNHYAEQLSRIILRLGSASCPTTPKF